MPRAALFRRNARPANAPPRPHAGARASADDRSPHRAHGVFDPARRRGELGLPVSAAVLQRVGPQGVSDAGNRGRDDGADPQLFERGGVGRSAEVGGSREQVRLSFPLQVGHASDECVSGLAETRGYNSYASKGVQVNSRQKRGFSYSPAGSYQADSSMCLFFLESIGPSATAVTDIVSLPRSDEPPFDRHDWIVRRGSTGEEVRYVIDYYGAPPLPDGSPVFSLDVRPALDNFSSISMRVRAATRSAWEKVVPETSHA